MHKKIGTDSMAPFYKVIDLETKKEIPFIIEANDKTGEYNQLLEGNKLIKKIGKIKLEWGGKLKRQKI